MLFHFDVVNEQGSFFTHSNDDLSEARKLVF